MTHTKIKFNRSSGFQKNIEKAARSIKPEQDAIEIPKSGGQMLIRKNSPEEKEREDLIKKAKCFPFEYDGEEFWVCVR